MKRAVVPGLLAAAFVAVLVLGIALGPVLTALALAGVLLVAAIWIWPHLGLVGMIVAGVGVPFLAAASETIPVSITQLLAFITLASYAHWALQNRVLPTFAPHMLAMAVFAAVVLLSTLVAPDHGQSLVGASVYLRGVLFALTIAVLATTRRSLLMVIMALTMAGALSSALGVAEYLVPGFHIASDDDLQYAKTGATVSTFNLEDDSTIQRVSGGTGNYNWLAYTIVLLLPLNLYWWHAYPRPRVRAVLLALTAVQLAALVLTYTRSAFIGLFAAGLYLVIKKQVKPWLPAAAIGLALLTLPFWAPDRFTERMFSREYLAKGTSVIRADFIVTGVQMFREKWLLGHGYGQFGEYFLKHSDSVYVAQMQEEIDLGAGTSQSIRPHNMYVDIAVDYGILGLAAFLGLLAMLMRDLQEIQRYGTESERRLAVVLQASLIAFSVCGLFGHNSIMRAPWALAGLVAAARRVVLDTHATVEATRD